MKYWRLKSIKGSQMLFLIIVMTIIPLLVPTLYGKRGIFTRSPLLWVFYALSFHCYHVHLRCLILLTDLISVYL